MIPPRARPTTGPRSSGLFSAYFPAEAPIVVRNTTTPTGQWVFRGADLHDGDALPGLLGYEAEFPAPFPADDPQHLDYTLLAPLVPDVRRQGAGLLAAEPAELCGHDRVSRSERRAGDCAGVALLAVGARCVQRQSAWARDRCARGGGEPVGLLVRQSRPAQPPRRPDHDERARAARARQRSRAAATPASISASSPTRRPRAPAGPAARRPSTRHATLRRRRSVA